MLHTCFGLLLLSFCACDVGLLQSGPDAAAPTAVRLRVEANPENSAAAVVFVSARGGHEVLVEVYSGSTLVAETPAYAMLSDTARVDVLGLMPEHSYELKAVVNSSSGERWESSPHSFTTASLPEDLPRLRLLRSTVPAAGFVMFGVTFSTSSSQKNYALIVDNEGSVVWYRKFSAPVVDFQKQPHGTYTAYSDLDGASFGRFYEMDRGGRILREFKAAEPNETGPHELRMIGSDRFLFGIEFRTLDLSSAGGLAAASVRGITVERHRGASLVFRWRTFDHFQVTDAAPNISLTGANVNPWHGNAIDIDTDGDLLVSFRNCDEITKISATTGQILWRLGGKNNEFTFLNDPLNGFCHQHGARRLPNGNIILFDNGNLHTPPVSRAVEYRLDEKARTATLVWEYRGAPELYSFALGFAQRLSNGNTLVCFGIAQRIVEVDHAGSVQWELALEDPNHFAYRAFRIESLY